MKNLTIQQQVPSVSPAEWKIIYRAVCDALPQLVNGKELNITLSATAYLGIEPKYVKGIQGEGWDTAVETSKENIAQLLLGESV